MTTTPAPTDIDQVRARHEVALRWLREGYSYDDNFNQAALLIRDDVPALLDKLATERRQSAAMASITGEAIRQLGEERDAAREELAKTRADNERLRGRLSQVGQRLHATLQHLSAEAEDELRAAWTAEDEEAARRGFAKRMTAEMANLATTAEVADEPKATCNGNCIYHLGEVVVEDLCCPLHGVEAEPAAG